ncbi:MAG: ribosome silencing factor [Flavobacteriaceae bacterium]|nr:ribosome silencing factor [Flavobacteriaceae bacterium]|tara:strand:+ start:15416 stop:15778 length:363 start_codon:yes stop_codon:yes gene_type:complete
MLKNVSNTKTLISEIIKAIEKVKGVNISLLDFCSLENTICNYFIICDGGSNTHVNAIVNSIKKSVSKSLQEKPYQTEGAEIGKWVLMDYIDVVVHVFQKKIREHYSIENLWGDAKTTQIA